MSDLAIKIRQNFAFLTAAVLFVVVYFFYNFAHPKGFTSAVFIQNSNEVFTLAMVSMAQTVPVLAAGLDLSVGASMTMIACFASYLLTGAPAGTPLALDFGGWRIALGTLPGGVTGIALGAVICLLIGAVAGLINGAVVVYGRIQPIIATLATGAIYIGIALFCARSPAARSMTTSTGRSPIRSAISPRPCISSTTGPRPGLLPSQDPYAFRPPGADRSPSLGSIQPLRHRPDHLRDRVGGRRSLMSGLDVNRARIAAFTLGGFFAACGGLFLAIETSSGNADIPQAGTYTLNSIAAVVIGGTSLLGGNGGAIGSVFGALILRVISYFFRIFDIAPLLQPLFEGIILLAAVSIGALRVLRVKNTLELFR